MLVQQSAYAYFRHIAALLHDDEPARPFVRFPLPDLVNSFNKGMAIVYARRPDLFADLRRVKLSTGSHQNFNEQVDSILQVVEQTTADGAIIKPVFTDRTNAGFGGKRAAWSLKRTPTIPRVDEDGLPINYTIDSVTMDRDMATSFVVHPPVPPEIDAYVTIKCIRPPIPLSVDNIDKTLIASAVHSTAVSHYVIADMLTGNRDSAHALNQAQYHMQQFYQILQIEQQTDQQLKQSQEI